MLLTCGDDNYFKIWSTSTWGSVSGGFDLGNTVMSCKFTSDNSVVAG